MKGCLVVIGSVLGLMMLLSIANAIVGSFTGAARTVIADRPPERSAGWSKKAVASTKGAATIVGGMSDDDKRVYTEGLTHIANVHQKPSQYTIAQVVDQQRARDEARDRERQATEERAKAERDRIAYEAAHHDYCADALKHERAAASDDISHQSQYDEAVAGLAANDKCENDDSHLVNEGYLLSMKGLAEHYLSAGDSRTDLNQANALLVRCQTTPGLYSTHVGAGCETQEQYNIRAQTQWEMDSY